MQTSHDTILRQQFRGAIVEPNTATYDDARKLYNGMIDKRPRLIAQCMDAADVAAAVNWGRNMGVDVAIRGGGHNGPGFASCNGGVVIDLSAMKGVRVNAKAGTVRVAAGCTQGDVDHATHAYGLAVPAGIVSTTGIAGLTLSGGHGYLTRKFGLTIDNLIEADVVLADGSMVTASADENSDLLWALRGGGGNFGVVTSFLFKAHPVHTVFGGPIAWDMRHAGDILRLYRDFILEAPEELGAFVGLKAVPATDPFPREHWGKKMCLLMSCYNGGEEAGLKALAPMLDKLPAPLFNWASMIPFPALQSMFDGLLPPGMQWYWRGDFVKTLPDAAIEAHIENAMRSPSELSLMHLYPINGAVHRVKQDASAWRMRDATWSMVIAGIDPNPQKAGELSRWAKTYWSAVHPYDLDGAYPNFMMDDEGEARVRATFGDNYPRLAAIKGRYDPNNLFHVNQNIRPLH